MNLNKLKYSMQQNISHAPGVFTRSSDGSREDPPEIQRLLQQMEEMKIKMKNVREGSTKQAAHFRQEGATKMGHAKSMQETPTSFDLAPSHQILQRISEFSTFTSGESLMLAEKLQSNVSDPCQNFIREDMVEAKKKKEVYDKAKSDYFQALERNRLAERALKQASQKDKMFFQDKFRESGQALDEAQDRYEILTRELESMLSIVCDASSAVIVKSLIDHFEAVAEYHETCFGWLKNFLATDIINEWKTYVKEKKVELDKKKAAGCGPSKKVYGNKIGELAQFDREINPRALPVPTPILKLIEFLNDHCLSVEGIFRLSGNQNEVDQERRKIDAWEKVEYCGIKDAHLVSGLLKKYLRDLPEPLCTYELFDEFLSTKDMPEDKACQILNQTMKKLPEVNRATFHAICQLCYNVQRFSDQNKMTAMNLGIVFAPSCLYTNNPAALEKSIDANGIVSFIILHVDEVFKGEVCTLPKATGGANAPPPKKAAPKSSSPTPAPKTPSLPAPKANKSFDAPAPAPPPAYVKTDKPLSPRPAPLPTDSTFPPSSTNNNRNNRGQSIYATPSAQNQPGVSPTSGNLLNLGSPSRQTKKRSATVGGGPPPGVTPGGNAVPAPGMNRSNKPPIQHLATAVGRRVGWPRWF